jgi:hypothetical protein
MCSCLEVDGISWAIAHRYKAFASYPIIVLQTNPANKAMKEFAKQMAHSTDEQSRYNKILK